MKKNINIPSTVFCWFTMSILLVTCTSDFLCAQTYDIVHQVQADQTLNVKTQIQYLGSVIADGAGEQANAKVVPLEVRGQFHFDQRISESSKSGPQAIRVFEKAAAEIKTGTERKDPQLENENRLLLARIKDSSGDSELQIASIGGVLSQKEYELLKNPGDPLSFTTLFDKTDVEVGEKWPVEKEQLGGFLAYDRIVSSSCNLMVKSVESGMAKVYIFGKVRGQVDDARSEATIKGIAQFDLEKKMVTSIRLAIDEERRPGAFAPGFEGKIKIDTRIVPAAANPLLSKDRMARQFKGKKIKFSFAFNRPNNAYRLTHDTGWRVIVAEDDEAVFRFVDGGDLIAQCNISEQPSRPKESPLSLSQFQQEVQQIIGQKEARVVDAGRDTSKQGYEVLRVAVEGVEEGIQFNWLYYHVTAQDGRRVAVIFTVEQDTADLVKGTERKLIDSIVFKQAKQAAAPNATQLSR